MIALLASTALAASPLPANYVRLSCTADSADEATFLLDFPTVEFTKLFRGDVRTLYRISGSEGSFWDDPTPTFVMDSWPSGLFIEFDDAVLNIDIEDREGPIGFVLEQAHEHGDGNEHAHDDEHADVVSGTCQDITEKALP